MDAFTVSILTVCGIFQSLRSKEGFDHCDPINNVD